MPQRTLTTRRPVHAAVWTLVASAAFALTLAACGPGPSNGAPPPTGDVSIAVTVIGDGRATFSALDFDCSDSCTLAVDEGTDVTLTAVPNAGRVLVAWDGPCNLFEPTCAWEADEDVAVTVTFAPHALRFELEGDGQGYFEIDAAGDATQCSEACAVALQQPLAVTITYFSEGSTRTILEPWDGECATASVTDNYCLVNVEGATTIGKTWRHPPRAANREYTTDQGTLLTVPEADGVLTGVDDTPGDTHTASPLTDPGNGTLTLAANGSFTYEPNPGFAGVDTFTFLVTDAFGNTDDASAEVTVNPRLTLTKQGGGSVVSEPGGIECGDACTSDAGIFDLDTDVTLTATAATGTTFQGWSGGDCDGSTEIQCVVTMDAPKSVTATFTASTYTLTVNRNGDGNVTSSPGDIDLDGGTNSDTFTHGTSVTLTANPAPGTVFTNWTGGPCAGQTSTTCSFTITSSGTTTANFGVIAYTLDVSRTGEGTGTIDSSPSGISVTTTQISDDASFDHGTSITLTADAADSSNFTSWSGVTCQGSNTSDTCTFTITSDTTVTGAFSLKTYDLAVSRTGDGTGNVTSSPGDINLNAGNPSDTFKHGTPITLTANPTDSSNFTSWSGVTCQGSNTSDTCTFTITGNTVVAANFDLKTYTLEVSRTGNGSGNITSSPGDINLNAGNPSDTFKHGTPITLTANRADSSNFTSWSGVTCQGGNTSDTCTFTITGNTAVTGTFTLKRYTLEVSRIGDGTGTITSNPTGINITTQDEDSTTFNHDTSVTLTALPSEGSDFESWSGVSCQGGNASETCVFTITSNTIITGTFTLDTHGLAVTRAGDGTGTIMSDPTGINVTPTQASDDATFAYGTSIELAAEPADDSTFTEWTGGPCEDETSATCAFGITSPTATTGIFDLKSYDLTVNLVGNGNVTSSPSGIDLEDNRASAAFDHGQEILLAAEPAAGNTFSEWTGGPCDGETSATCTFDIVSDGATTATFDVEVLTLNVTTSGSGAGGVVSSPAGVDVEANDSTASFDHGKSITLTATAGELSEFAGWTSGPCAGDTIPACEFVIREDLTVDAAFDLETL